MIYNCQDATFCECGSRLNAVVTDVPLPKPEPNASVLCTMFTRNPWVFPVAAVPHFCGGFAVYGSAMGMSNVIYLPFP